MNLVGRLHDCITKRILYLHFGMPCMYLKCFTFKSKYNPVRMISGNMSFYKWSNAADDTGYTISNTWCYQNIYRLGDWYIKYDPSQFKVHVKCEKEMCFTNNTSQPECAECLTPRAIKWHTASAMAFIPGVPSETWMTCWLIIFWWVQTNWAHCVLCGLWPMISYK